MSFWIVIGTNCRELFQDFVDTRDPESEELARALNVIDGISTVEDIGAKVEGTVEAA